MSRPHGQSDHAPSCRRIRRAYKRKALELHPDRNINDVQNATRKFAEVQTAYEVLSDPQERAWYDSHRDAILRGDPDGDSSSPYEHNNQRVTTTEELYSLMGRFNTSVPFDDSPRGFFGILNLTFDQLAAEEAAACDWDGQPVPQYPPFGSADDDHESTARPFYNAWSGFSTKKSFSWKDKYRLSEAPDRRIRRLMEKENRKFRDDAIRDFNDAVRSLVAFVKKRDPRYIASSQSEAERQKALRDSVAAQAARSRAANQEKLANYTEPDWIKSRELDEDHLSEFSMSEEESEVEQIECVVCNKSFKSEKQFQAHEKSKKHIKAVQQLRREMKKQDTALELDAEQARPEVDAQTATSNLHASSASENGFIVEPKQASNGQRSLEKANTGDEGNGAGQTSPGQSSAASASPSEISDDDDYAPRHSVQDRLISQTREGEPTDPSQLADESLPSQFTTLNVDSQPVPKKVGRAKAKREKKAAREAAQGQQGNVVCCQTPGQGFGSRRVRDGALTASCIAPMRDLRANVPVPKQAL